MEVHPGAMPLINKHSGNLHIVYVAECAVSEALNERDTLRAQVAAMREALEPLRHMELWTESAEDHEMCLLSYGTVKKLRALITLKDQSNDH